MLLAANREEESTTGKQGALPALLFGGKGGAVFLHPSNITFSVDQNTFVSPVVYSFNYHNKNCTGTGDITDEKDDVVPIVVGSVLAAIIVVVLGLYFVLRMRRGRRPTNAAA